MDELLKKYRSRLVKEAVLKSVLYGLTVALVAVAVSSLVFWAIDFKQVWVSAIVFVVVLGVSAAILYTRFRPTERAIAKRMDAELGLDERMITLLELKGNQEVLACAQRANAVSAVRAFGPRGDKKIALKVLSLSAGIVLAAVSVVAANMVTVSGLTAADILPSGADLVRGDEGVKAVYTISYLVEGAGKIVGVEAQEGEDGSTVYSQTVTEGEAAKAVWAVAGKDEDAEYYFAGWSDGGKDPFRLDENVEADTVLTAVFLPIDGTDFEPETDWANRFPLPPAMDDSGDGAGGGFPSPDESDPEEDGSGEGEGAGGSANPAFQVNDGKTDYGGSTYENAVDEATETISSSDGYSDDLIGIIEDYMDIIKR